MNLVVLTTETTHHCHFVRAVAERHGVSLVLAERDGPTPPFETHHPCEDERDAHERRAWFDGREPRLADHAPTGSYGSLNDSAAVERLRSARPDVVVVFGTGKLHAPVIESCPDAILNLHGGDPESYRGLDTHLWAIHDGRFDELITTLHRGNGRLDDGAIVERRPIPIDGPVPMFDLRRRSTDLCVEMVVDVLDRFVGRGCIESRPQRRRGRYFSFMPATLKGVCRERFERHTGARP